MIWVIMLYIINSIQLIKPVNNEVGHNDNKAGLGSADCVSALRTDLRFPSYVAAALFGFKNRQDSILINTQCLSTNL